MATLNLIMNELCKFDIVSKRAVMKNESHLFQGGIIQNLFQFLTTGAGKLMKLASETPQIF